MNLSQILLAIWFGVFGVVAAFVIIGPLVGVLYFGYIRRDLDSKDFRASGYLDFLRSIPTRARNNGFWKTFVFLCSNFGYVVISMFLWFLVLAVSVMAAAFLV